MAIVLVVRTMDVNYATVDGATVNASFDGGTATKMTKVDKSAFELPVTAGVKKVEVSVTLAGFFPVTQKLDLNQSGTPTLKFDGPQVLNVRNLDNHSRDSGDHSMEVVVVLGQLRDGAPAAKKVAADETAKGKNIFFDPRTLDIIHLADGVLVPKGGTGVFNHTITSVTLAGTMLFAERISAPKMLAIYMPNRTTKTLQRGNEEMQQVPIPYHVFFHPSTGHFAPTNYPFSHDYMDLIGRYVFYNQQWNLGKAMANQHEASGKKVVFVFPVGGRVTSFGNMNTQAGILRVLQEVNYFIQRMQGVPFPLQPLGKVGISGFSSGFRSVASVLGSRRVDVFHDKLLSEVYSFDGVFMTKDANKKDIVDVPATLNTINAIKAWLRGGARGRTIRIYSQSRIWLDQLRGSITNPTTVNGADNSMEVFGDSGTLLHTPSVMWRSVEPAIERIGVDVNQLQKSVHQFIPAMFMQHAIKMSKL